MKQLVVDHMDQWGNSWFPFLWSCEESGDFLKGFKVQVRVCTWKNKLSVAGWRKQRAAVTVHWLQSSTRTTESTAWNSTLDGCLIYWEQNYSRYLQMSLLLCKLPWNSPCSINRKAVTDTFSDSQNPAVTKRTAAIISQCRLKSLKINDKLIRYLATG